MLSKCVSLLLIGDSAYARGYTREQNGAKSTRVRGASETHFYTEGTQEWCRGKSCVGAKMAPTHGAQEAPLRCPLIQ